jgi:cytochrome c biogenesis protein CcmG/thiol:disulfide interchange protein DsbE
MNKTVWRSIIAVIALVALLFLYLLSRGLMNNPGSIPTALIGKPAFDFAVPAVANVSADSTTPAELNLSAFKGRPLIINFWASWCASCADEAPGLEKFYQEYKDKVAMIGIAIQDTPQKAREVAAQHGSRYPIGVDEEGKSAIDYGVTGVPETFFIDKEGIIRFKFAAPVTYQELVGAYVRYFEPGSP